MVEDKTTYMDPLSISHKRIKGINYYEIYYKGNLEIKMEVGKGRKIILYPYSKNVSVQMSLGVT